MWFANYASIKKHVSKGDPAHHLLHSRGTSLLRPALTVITFQPTSALAPAALPHPCIQRILLKMKSDYSTPPRRTSNDSHLTRSLPGLTPTDPRRPSLPTPASRSARSLALLQLLQPARHAPTPRPRLQLLPLPHTLLGVSPHGSRPHLRIPSKCHHLQEDSSGTIMCCPLLLLFLPP